MDAQHLDEHTMQALVAQVMARLTKPTLLVLNRAHGYQQEIAAHLSRWPGIGWHILVLPHSDHELAAMQHLGTQVTWDGHQPATWLASYQQVLFPFLDMATLAEVSQGLHFTPAAQLLQYALMMGLPTYALDYQCNLTRELNQVLGLARNPAMCQRATSQLATLANLGAVIGSCADIQVAMTGDGKVASDRTRRASSARQHPSAYITLNEVMSQGVDAFSLQDNLTDLAAEYLKQQQT